MPPNPQVLDLFESSMPSKLRQVLQTPAGKRQVIALFNWLDEPQDLALEMKAFGLGGQYWLMREFWTGEWANVDSDYVSARCLPMGCGWHPQPAAKGCLPGK